MIKKLLGFIFSLKTNLLINYYHVLVYIVYIVYIVYLFLAQRTGAHGFSVWTHYKQVCWNFWNNISSCNAVDMRGSCHEWGGPHWNSRDFAVYGSESGIGRNWHPTKGIHLLRGELLAYNYAHILLDAIDLVETDRRTKSAAAMAVEYQSVLDVLQPPMTDTVLHCHSECETRPTCWTNYEPHFNDKFFLDELVVGTHEGWSKHTGKVTDDHIKYGYLDIKHFYQVYYYS